MISSFLRHDAFSSARRRHIARTGCGVLVLISAVLFVAGCSSKNNKSARRREAPANPVSVAKVVAKDIPLQVKAIGTVEAYSTVQVKAQVSGPLVGVYFREGQYVKKGELLFKIDPRPFDIAVKQAEANLAKDQALLKTAEDDVGRYKGLAEKDYVTQERYDQIRANADVLRAAVKADEAVLDNARLELDYCTIASPLEGRTGRLMVQAGNLVKANDSTPLTVIYQISPIYVLFSVPEQNLPLIKKFMAQGGLKTEVIPEMQTASVPGTLTFIDNGIDETTGTIALKATFPNADKALWPGQFLNVILTLTVEKNVVTIPTPAVQTGQNGMFVLVVKDNLTVELRPVEPERAYQGDTIIRSGLKPGETVVTDGQLRLVPGSRVAIKKSL
jgi:multidrug efflux system membrane fusion protein